MAESQRLVIIRKLIDRLKEEKEYEIAANQVKQGIKANDVRDTEIPLLVDMLLQIQKQMFEKEVEFMDTVEMVVDEFTTTGDFDAATRLIKAPFPHHLNMNSNSFLDQLNLMILYHHGDIKAFDTALERIMSSEVDFRPRIAHIMGYRLIDTGLTEAYDTAMTITEQGLKQAKKDKDEVMINRFTHLSRRIKKLKKKAHKSGHR
ncbi:hypothetical protein RND81_06G191500 [Saponaria officinalis]|uniref:Uncharacterized protein n=1 Tax=Saponaria officinalis TaxID=3572 RepID=A0AAW1K843_SAPOF